MLFLIVVPVLGGTLIFIAKKAHPHFIKVFDEYDNLNRLVAEGGDKTVTYTYDDVGNLIKETNGKKSTTYTYNNLNQQIQKREAQYLA